MSTERDAQSDGKGRLDESLEEMPDESRRELARKILGGAGAAAVFGLLAEALGPSEAAAAGPFLRRTPGLKITSPVATLKNVPLKLETLKDGFSLQIESRELAEHLTREGIIDQKHRNGVASLQCRLSLVGPMD